MTYDTKATPELGRLREAIHVARLKGRVESLKRSIAEAKSGRTISAATRDKLKDMHDNLSAVIANLTALMEGDLTQGDDSEPDSDGTGISQGA
jgi:predicted RNA-binding protein (virulence factor B family)